MVYAVEGTRLVGSRLVPQAVKADHLDPRRPCRQRRVPSRVRPPNLGGELRPGLPRFEGVAGLQRHPRGVRDGAEPILVPRAAGPHEEPDVGAIARPRSGPPFVPPIPMWVLRSLGRGRVVRPAIDSRSGPLHATSPARCVIEAYTRTVSARRVDKVIIAAAADDSHCHAPRRVSSHHRTVVATEEKDSYLLRLARREATAEVRHARRALGGHRRGERYLEAAVLEAHYLGEIGRIRSADVDLAREQPVELGRGGG